ncbi:transmembrane 9 superfamily member 1-like, partial [Paramuricea clavata]
MALIRVPFLSGKSSTHPQNLISFIKLIVYLFTPDSFANKEACLKTVTSEDIEHLRSAIEDHYYFELVLDDIRLHGFVGHFSEGHLLPHTHSVQLFTHLHFYVAHNGQKIIFANVTTGSPELLPENGDLKEIQFTYGVQFVATT